MKRILIVKVQHVQLKMIRYIKVIFGFPSFFQIKILKI